MNLFSFIEDKRFFTEIYEQPKINNYRTRVPYLEETIVKKVNCISTDLLQIETSIWKYKNKKRLQEKTDSYYDKIEVHLREVERRKTDKDYQDKIKVLLTRSF